MCVSNKVIRSRCGWRVCAASCKESLVLGTGVEGVRRMEEGGAGHHPLPRVPDFLARALGQDRPSKRAPPGACLALLETSATGNYRRESTDASASAAEATTYTNDGLSEEVGNLERANKHGEGLDLGKELAGEGWAGAGASMGSIKSARCQETRETC